MKKFIALVLSAFVLYYFEWQHVITAKHYLPLYIKHLPAVLMYPSAYLFLIFGIAKIILPLVAIYYLIRISSEYRYGFRRALATSAILIVALFVLMAIIAWLLNNGLSLTYFDAVGKEHLRVFPFMRY